MHILNTLSLLHVWSSAYVVQNQGFQCLGLSGGGGSSSNNKVDSDSGWAVTFIHVCYTCYIHGQ